MWTKFTGQPVRLKLGVVVLPAIDYRITVILKPE